MVDMETLASLCKRRAIIFQSSEIYGGINGFWDYGPIGTELRRRIKDSWWRFMVQSRSNVVGLDTTIIAHPRTWEASGHINSFSDPMVDCKKCKRRFRADQEDLIGATACPECGGELTEPSAFNLMFQTNVGAKVDSASVAYLRPETCQSIFTQFRNVTQTARVKVPFGIAQIGKAFRNEITPRNFIFRSREFEQMEMEFFCHPEESAKWYKYWIEQRLGWFKALGIKESNLRLRDHSPDELAHYASGCADVEFQMPFGWSELEGIADRGTYDLSQHSEFSGTKLEYLDQVNNDRFVPAVIETSVGVDRTLLAILADAYREEDVNGEKRVVLGLHPSLAPVQAAIMPLSQKLNEPTEKIANDLRVHFSVELDAAGSIGRRYRRQDEIGTPFCLTYDFESVDDGSVTVRHRDSMAQERIAVDQIRTYLTERLTA